MSTQTETVRVPTCQVCGRVIKAKSGIIAHHGYQRPGHGWQTASCFGARYRPYEMACDALPPAIEGIQRFITAQENFVHETMKNPPETITETPRYLGHKTRTYTRPENFDARECVNRGSHNAYSYENTFSYKIRDAKMQAQGAKKDKKFFEERLANWRPRLLTKEG